MEAFCILCLFFIVSCGFYVIDPKTLRENKNLYLKIFHFFYFTSLSYCVKLLYKVQKSLREKWPLYVKKNAKKRFAHDFCFHVIKKKLMKGGYVTGVSVVRALAQKCMSDGVIILQCISKIPSMLVM